MENQAATFGNSTALAVPLTAGGDLGIDFAAIARRIPGIDPAGPSLRYESVYDQIREAAREDDPNLPQGIWQTALKRADWKVVKTLSLDVVANRSKDLQVAAWLVEALIHLHGFAGAAAGFRVIDSLCRKFWVGLHPRMQDNDIEFRIAPFVWINEKLSVKVLRVPLTRPAGGDAPPYCLVDWDNALRLENQALRQKKSKGTPEKEGKATRAEVLASVAATPAAHLAALLVDVRHAQAALRGLEAWLDETCGRGAPGFSQFKTALAQVDDLLATFLRDKGEVVAEAGAEAPTPAAPATEQETEETAMAIRDDVPAPASAGGPIQSRAEAYRRLAEAADYLLKTEPHSPVPYLVRRAVSWGAMPLSDLLVELLRDRNDLTQMFDLLGIPPELRGNGRG